MYFNDVFSFSPSVKYFTACDGGCKIPPLFPIIMYVIVAISDTFVHKRFIHISFYIARH